MHDLLGYRRHRLLPGRRVDTRQVDTVDGDASGSGVAQLGQELHQSRLAGAVVADHGQRGPHRDGEIESDQHVAVAARVGEAHVLEADFAAGDRWGGGAACGVLSLGQEAFEGGEGRHARQPVLDLVVTERHRPEAPDG